MRAVAVGQGGPSCGKGSRQEWGIPGRGLSCLSRPRQRLPDRRWLGTQRGLWRPQPPSAGAHKAAAAVSLEKPLNFQARQERQTQGSSLPLFKREKGCPSVELSALSPAIVPSSENLSLGDRQRLWAPRCPHSGLFVGRERQWAARQPLGRCRSGPMLPGLRFGISSPLRMPG